MKALLENLRDFGRPLVVLALVLVLLLGAVISGLLELFLPGMGITFTVGVAGWFRAVPPEYYALTGAAIGGYTMSRGFESVARSKHGVPPRGGARPPARPASRHAPPHSSPRGHIRPDDPDGDC